jgi:hypothetical protein
MKVTNKLLMLALAFSFSANVQAELKFEQTQIELHPSPADANAVAHFKFENTGDKPIHISSVQTSCGCTVASLKSNDVAPGDKGEITATLSIGNRTGLQHKTVTVMTDDPAAPQTILTLRAQIPTLLQVQPIFVFWKQDEELKPKTIKVTVDASAPVKKISVSSSDPEISAKVEPGKGGKEWKIDVLPKDVKKLHNSTLTIAPDFPATTPPKFFYATARVIASGTTQ